MAKKPTISFVCQECGYDSPQWLGKCPECGAWNSMKEIRIQPLPTTSGPMSSWTNQSVAPQKLQDIAYQEKSRIQTNFEELNTVLGGGIVAGSLLLIAGDPGVGKSTLLLELSLALGKTGKKVLYVSGEESPEQIKLRADRVVGAKKAQVSTENVYLLALTDPDTIVTQIEDLSPDLVVIDSIQTLESPNASGLSGSVAQVRYGALRFVRAAKQLNIPIILVGHVTKEGMVAGPMVLSHMVDTVLFLEGEKFTTTRILRSLKNRFGPVDEVGIFIMDETGMREIKDPGELFLNKERSQTPGSVLVSTLEGSRAFLVELQALAVYSKLPMPRRVVAGIDPRRVELLLAVLQKQCRLPVESMDIFVNVAGGIKLSDPGIDLGICLAIYSSVKNIPVTDMVGIAEVGLLGELRRVSGIAKRVREAKKLGFSEVITSDGFKTIQDVIVSIQKKGRYDKENETETS